MTTTSLAPGLRVRVARPENPRHPFVGASGTVDAVAVPGRSGRAKIPDPDRPGRMKGVPVELPDTLAFVFFACAVPPPAPRFARGITMALWESELEVLA